MSTIARTIRNTWRVGIKDFGKQIQYLGDTKSGTHIGTDRAGNRYFENTLEELPLRTRWVSYHDSEYDPSQIDPGWHAWMSYLVHEPPVTKNNEGLLGGQRGTGLTIGQAVLEKVGGSWGRGVVEKERKVKQAWEIGQEEVSGDKLMEVAIRDWEIKEHRPNVTMGRGAYRPYSTVKSKVGAWTPVAKPRRSRPIILAIRSKKKNTIEA